MFSLFAVYRQMHATRLSTHLEMKLKQKRCHYKDLKKKFKFYVVSRWPRALEVT